VLKLTVSIILIFLIFCYIGINKVYNELLNANFYYITAALFAVTFQIILKAIRWKSIIQIFNKTINTKSSINYTLISLAFSIVTPGRVGEFIKAKYLVDKTEIGYLKSISSVVIDKVFDIITVILLGLVGLSFLQQNFLPSDYFVYALAAYIAALISIYIFLGKIHNVITNFLPKKFKESFGKLRITRRFYIRSLIFSLFIWLTLSLQAFFVIKALSVQQVSFYVIVVVVPLMAISSMIPVSLGGLGVREVVAIYFLSLLGVPAEKSAIFSLLYTFLAFGIPAAIGAVLFLRRKRKFA
tara:strand:+ start:4129 stop:5022 length:894 start_codon:yes stop_codon:yes gene_type:complete